VNNKLALMRKWKDLKSAEIRQLSNVLFASVCGGRYQTWPKCIYNYVNITHSTFYWRLIIFVVKWFFSNLTYLTVCTPLRPPRALFGRQLRPRFHQQRNALKSSEKRRIISKIIVLCELIYLLVWQAVLLWILLVFFK